MSFFSHNKPKPSVSFSIDHDTLRYVAVVRNPDGIQVNDHGSLFLGSGIISPTGDIVDDMQFLKTVRTVISGLDFGTEDPVATFVVPDCQSFVFHTHISKEPPKEMNDVIVDHLKTYCEAHDLIHYADAVCEYDIILETEFGYDVHATLVPKRYIQNMMGLFKQAGVTLTHAETAHHAVALSCLDIAAGTGVVLVSFGKHQSTVALVHADHLVSQEIVPVGYHHFIETVEKFLRIDTVAAEKIMDRHGLLQTHPDVALLGELYQVLDPLITSIDRQLITIGKMQYKTYGYRFVTDSIMVYGEGVHVAGLVPLIGEKVRLHAKELDIWAGHAHDRAAVFNLHANDVLTYAEPLALALLYLK